MQDPSTKTQVSDAGLSRAREVPALNEGSSTTWLDRWMAENPWHARVAPFAAYVLLMPVVDLFRHEMRWLGPVAYVAQLSVVAWLLWRYRKLFPELNIKFHWLAVPVGLIVAWLWIQIGLGMVAWQPDWFKTDGSSHYLEKYGWHLRSIGMPIRLIGMAIVVPLFEELFVRSLLLRGLNQFRPTMIGLAQVLQDLPVIGDLFIKTALARKAAAHPPMFTVQFERTPLGKLTWFGVIASTLIFTSYHLPRDWAGCLVCGLAYCWLLHKTAHKGLGPVVWAHGITNAALWAYTWHTGDWQFL